MNPRRLRTLSPIVLLGALLAIALVGAVALVQATDNKPGIVFILTDNVVYGEPGIYGGDILRGAPTPRIDKLDDLGIFDHETDRLPRVENSFDAKVLPMSSE
jgi:hypothetical protein